MIDPALLWWINTLSQASCPQITLLSLYEEFAPACDSCSSWINAQTHEEQCSCLPRCGSLDQLLIFSMIFKAAWKFPAGTEKTHDCVVWSRCFWIIAMGHFQPCISCCFTEAWSWGQQPKRRHPDFPLCGQFIRVNWVDVGWMESWTFTYLSYLSLLRGRWWYFWWYR